MSSFTIKTKGLKELKVALRRLPDSTAKGVMRRTMKEVLEPVKRMAKALAPEAQGELKDSITISSKLSKSQKRKFKKHSKHDVYMFVGAGPLPQAHLQEYGTVHHDTQPFMRPAWDMNKRQVFENTRKTMWEEIKKTIARRAKRVGKK